MLRQIAVSVASRLPAPIRSWIRGNPSLHRVASTAFGRLVGSEIAEISTGPLRGIKLACSEHTSHAHLRGSYELETLEALDRLVQPGFVCYDIGASIGYISLLLARKSKQVYAFEPAPHARAEMSRHIRANGFGNVEIFETPLSGDVRVVSFGLTEVAYGSAINEAQTRWPVLKLTTSTLDLFLKDHLPPDLIKIDIEGEEEVLFNGARQLLASHRPIIVCELHSQNAADAVLSTLSANRYEIQDLQGKPFQTHGRVVAGEVHIVGLPR